MGVTPLFCCFKKQNPLCVVITALVANVIAIFAFLLLIEGDIDLIDKNSLFSFIHYNTFYVM